MTLNQAKRLTAQKLALGGIDDALVESELLLCHVLEISRTQLYTEFDQVLTPAEVSYLDELVRRRLQHEPAAYILRNWEFYGSEFYIDQRVLIPRPETELLVEETIACVSCHSQKESIAIADVGTGSGIVAISLALAFPQAKIYATDVSVLALEVAEINCRRHGVNNQITLLQGNLLEPLPGPVDIIVANLPYIKDSELEVLNPEITNFEPTIALSGGEDGLDTIRAFLNQLRGEIYSEGCVLMEVGTGQAQTVISLINNYFPQSSASLVPDLGGIDRIVRFFPVENRALSHILRR